MVDLKDKVAIVTDASAGIGRASAKLFARAGAKVVVAARRKTELDSLVREIAGEGGDALALAGDVSDEAFAKELVERAEQSYGRLDVGFNNAGILGEKGPTTGISLEGWNGTLKVNLTSAFLAAKHQIPAMLKQGKGSIIFTSTVVGYTVGFPGFAAYATSKSGLIGLTQAVPPHTGGAEHSRQCASFRRRRHGDVQKSE
jgi:NAD(P)-dependent dehydrogenase (short-subunit alcohol dehydrogenase family)